VLGRCSSQAKRGVPEARKRRRATTLSIRRTGPERRALLPRWVGRSYHERHYVTKRRIRAKEGSFSLRRNAPFYFFLSNVESCRSMVVIQASTQQSIDRAQDANLFPRAAHCVLLESAELLQIEDLAIHRASSMMIAQTSSYSCSQLLTCCLIFELFHRSASAGSRAR